VIQFVDRNKSLIGLFDYAFTPEGKLRCQADCDMTASGWTVLPEPCGQDYSTEAAYVVHLKSSHVFDFKLGERCVRTWLDRMCTLPAPEIVADNTLQFARPIKDCRRATTGGAAERTSTVEVKHSTPSSES
jgi:hypothetical protein